MLPLIKKHMKRIFYFFTAVLIGLFNKFEGQCFQKLGEVQDTSGVGHAIGLDGQLYEFTPTIGPSGGWTVSSNLIFPGVNDWYRVFSEDYNQHVLALKNDSTLWEFGAGVNLVQIGNEKWKDISFLWGPTCGIKSNGTLWRWGAGLAGMVQMGIANDWKNIEVLNYWYNNWNSVRLIATKNDNSLWYYDFNSPNPQWIQLGIGMQWGYIKGVYSVGAYSIYGINNNGDLYRWDNPSNSPVIVGTGPWKEIACTGNLLGIMGLKVDGSLYTWTSFDQNPINPVLFPSNSLFTEIDLSWYGVFGLSSSSVSLMAAVFPGSFYPPVGIGTPCCNNQSSISLNVCDSITWNGQWLDSSGTYTAQLNNINGCDSTVTLNLTVNTLPTQPTISIQNTNELITALQPESSYQWLDCGNGNVLINDTMNYLLVNTGGEFAVAVSNQCGSDTSDCLFFSSNALGSSVFSQARVYPNPTDNDFTVELPDVLLGESYTICNALGAVIQSGVFLNNVNNISLHNLSEGYYLIHWKSQNSVLRVVKN